MSHKGKHKPIGWAIAIHGGAEHKLRASEADCKNALARTIRAAADFIAAGHSAYDMVDSGWTGERRALGRRQIECAEAVEEVRTDGGSVGMGDAEVRTCKRT